MTDARTAILRGKRAAARLHRDFGMRDRIRSEGSRIDVFGTIINLDVPLLFKPLEGLLGVFINDPMPGVMVTTKRSLSVQRFTGAHELGHFSLGHHPSLDDDSMLRRSPFAVAPNYGQQELEADAFATEFLLPPWLFAEYFKRQGWTPDMMADPAIVYQLSLRVGASYEATCRSLVRPGVRVIDRKILTRLLHVKPRSIKTALLDGYEPADFRRDVWLLTEKDEGAMIEGSRSDLFVLKLAEHSGSGYTWTFEELNDTGFAVVRDERDDPDSDLVGAHVTRSITGCCEEPHEGSLSLAERRPWIKHGAPLSAFCMRYDLYGPEVEGFSQAERRHLLEVA